MATLGDAVVIRIVGDSQGLQGSLDEVLSRFEELQSRVERLAGASTSLSRLGTAISSAQTPLVNLGRQFDQVQRSADGLSRTTITLNVSPALNALAQLSAAIARVQAQLQALSVPIGGGGGPVPAGPGAGPIRQFASGGFVEGPTGVDRVPAYLTAGEFVLSPGAVEQLGLPFLQRLNAAPASVAPSTNGARRQESPPAGGTQVTTQFGGVTIQVQQPSELGTVLETLMIEEIGLRNRRG